MNTVQHIDRIARLIESAKNLATRQQSIPAAVACLSDALLETHAARDSAQADAADLRELAAYRAGAPRVVES